jgi:hypothetical protein
MTTDPNRQAFPHTDDHNALTIREYFAIQALPACLGLYATQETAVKEAVKAADLLIAELNK